MTRQLLSFAVLLSLCSCDLDKSEPATSPTVELVQTPLAETGDPRFEVRVVQYVDDHIAYGGRRGVYLIKDKQTGEEYIGVSGIGIVERSAHQESYTTTDGKHVQHHTRTVEDER